MRKKLTAAGLAVAPFLLIFISLFIGRYPLSMGQVIGVLGIKTGLSATAPLPIHINVVWDIRLPRAILGALVGGSLAVSGAAFQGLFRNPLVSSGVLGVSAGAGFGASLAIILFGSDTFYVYAFAFCFGILAVVLSYVIGTNYTSTPTIMLVLGGVVVSSIFSSLVSLLKYIADPYEQLPSIVFWLMGSMASARFKDIAISAIPMGVGMAGLVAMRWRLNVLSMDDREAQALGVNIIFVKGLAILFATLATAGAVCVSGVIGWVGLVVPHMGRMLSGNDNTVLVPTCLSIGAGYLIIVDNVARTLTGSEIPLGILTSIMGAPFFVYLLKKTKGRGW
ncbi:MAG: iron ABC transporter permease [Firmicutes bacterium]|nr:iron ABC transporter permease [Bacillota bacterium]MDD3298901.1 iron ABC transporter permease [Bacillota bacterium]MDD3851371.1 iron ABC transporter permease [Bacillota bacterium]